MDVVTAIMNDHRVLEGLFDELYKHDEDRAVLVAEVRARLRAHSRAEERYVYPVLARVRPSEATGVAVGNGGRLGLVHRGTEEHREADDKLAALEAAIAGDFHRALKEFIDAVGHHVAEEESKILPAIKESMSFRKRDELGRRFESHRISELRRAGIDDSLTKEDLYIKAQRAGIAGRSSMSRGELARALLAARTRAVGK
jgi:hemerythrin superfamily protein